MYEKGPVLAREKGKSNVAKKKKVSTSYKMEREMGAMANRPAGVKVPTPGKDLRIEPRKLGQSFTSTENDEEKKKFTEKKVGLGENRP